MPPYCLVVSLVHVKKVEIFGFKSFGFKNTTVHFEPGLVSISGPNGSGKSNILDAIIFAMGENKPKVMRVDRLRSLIHDIEGNSRGPKMVRSSVHFDNTDRKIPVDSDTVEVTREMDDKGENTYYLNKKKTARNHILDMLDMAHAGLGQLNAVQQGTVTRISEMSSDEKRVTIENMLGLSSFDEKKAAAIKQLDDADHRLTIALTKIDSIRDNLVKLEEERNQKMRHDLLERELARYRAIDAANKLNETVRIKTSKEDSLHTISESMEKLGRERADLHSEIDSLESEKSALMSKAGDFNRAKAAIEGDLSKIRQEYDGEESAIVTAQKRTAQIESRLESIKAEMQDADGRKTGISKEIKDAADRLESINLKKTQIQSKQETVDLQRKKILDEQSQAAAKKSEIDNKLSSLNEQLNRITLLLDGTAGKKRDTLTKIKSNTDLLGKIKESAANLSTDRQRLRDIIQNHTDSISELNAHMGDLSSKRTKITQDMEELDLLLEKSNKAANQHESKIRTVREFMHEDYTVAKLKEHADKLGIVGLAYEIMSWEKKYERPILAAGSDWLKAIVVNDLATLLGIAEFARSKKLPKLKMIPLEAIADFKTSLPKIPGALSLLSDYVQCDDSYTNLKAFLFGNVVLADSKQSAYAISMAGYKSVTLEGEFFEARAGTVVVDINSKISKLTKLISMSTDIEGLFLSIKLIKRYVQKQKRLLKRHDDSIEGYARRKSVSEKALASASEMLSNLESQLESAQKQQMRLDSRIRELSTISLGFSAEISKHESHADSIRERISIVKANYADGQQARIASEISRINERKSEVERLATGIMKEYNDAFSALGALKSEYARGESDAGRLREEEHSLLGEKQSLESSIIFHEERKNIKHEILVDLRQREQDLLSSSGSSIDDLQDYDIKIKDLSGKERNIDREINSLQRKSDSLGRDIGDLTEDAARLRQVISSSGLEKNAETFDVSHMIHDLSSELRSMDPLNARAPESYLEVYDGYRLLSPRRNSLEEERNSIIKFIERIDRDKKQTFLDAFDRVDKEIRLIFSKMTGGNAWLELQNEDDIFGSGISYLIQFPNKPKRESTSISGGEKTLAAIVFVLALQRLEPSPFYLFDEIDAHLDAPNSERLAKILEERAQESQFIMVSLKDSVVQKAGLIYGVYPKNGVSNVVTYKDKRVARASQGQRSRQ